MTIHRSRFLQHRRFRHPGESAGGQGVSQAGVDFVKVESFRFPVLVEGEVEIARLGLPSPPIDQRAAPLQALATGENPGLRSVPSSLHRVP